MSHYPAGPWVRVIVNCSNSEKQWQNDLWYKVTPPVPANTDVTAVAAAINSALKPSYVAWMTSECDWNGVDVYLNNGTYTVAAHVVENTPGTQDPPMLPTEDAAIVSINSGLAARAGVGRIYVGGVSSSLVLESRLTTGGIGFLTTLMDSLKNLTTAGGVTLKLGVWSRKLNELNSFNFTQVEGILGHRRRRRPRR